jgi:hypothetical protein
VVADRLLRSRLWCPGAERRLGASRAKADEARLNALGYDAERQTAATVRRERLMKKAFVLVGAGLRLIAQNTPLFERLVTVAHVDAAQAKLCFRIPPRRSNDVFLPRNSTNRHHDRALILF